jgi:hypothetical protein
MRDFWCGEEAPSLAERCRCGEIRRVVEAFVPLLCAF